MVVHLFNNRIICFNQFFFREQAFGKMLKLCPTVSVLAINVSGRLPLPTVPPNVCLTKLTVYSFYFAGEGHGGQQSNGPEDQEVLCGSFGRIHWNTFASSGSMWVHSARGHRSPTSSCQGQYELFNKIDLKREMVVDQHIMHYAMHVSMIKLKTSQCFEAIRRDIKVKVPLLVSNFSKHERYWKKLYKAR